MYHKFRKSIDAFLPNPSKKGVPLLQNSLLCIRFSYCGVQAPSAPTLKSPIFVLVAM